MRGLPIWPERGETVIDRPLWEVAVPVPLRRTFVYEIPNRLGRVAPGCRVLVPFGRRRITGYVVEPFQGDEEPAFGIKAAIQLLDEEPAIPGDLLSFLVEAADYYLHPVGEVMRAALPPGIDPLEKKGEIRGPRVKTRRHLVAHALDGARQALESMARKAPARAAVLQAIVELKDAPVADLRAVHRDASRHVRKLQEEGLVKLVEVDRSADPYFSGDIDADDPPVLTSEQKVAVEAIHARMDSGGYGGFMLQGVTGSGKTEVYLRAVEKTLGMERGALVLVPEITLTPQLVRRYRARFGNALAVWHSGLSDRERFEQWQSLRAGRVKVAIGVRSAVFAPVSNLGVIIVDEEHDGSFKQERGFSYNARDLALLRAARTGAVAVLGSATPSMETRRNAEVGKLARLVLEKRAIDQPLPSVEILDLRRHRNGPGGQNVISGPLHEAIARTLEREEQSILFINRRGFAPSLVCPGCGKVHGCDDCSVSLTFHTKPAGLVCHYCGARRPLPSRCPDCGEPDQRPVGMGTQKVEELLCQLFPGARVARLDRDVASGQSAEAILDGLRTGEVDILVGTQMVTKGHDFPRVTLVGVLLGDVGLHMPDFRAAERTFQLLTQVAGRAGRSQLGGRAIIQTYSPSHPAITLASEHDFDAFARLEMEARKDLGYPPFGRLCAIRLSGTDGVRVESAAREIAASIRDAMGAPGASTITMLGPVPAPIPVVQKRHRWRILLRAPRQDRIRALLTSVLGALEGSASGVTVRVDVDPNSML